VIQAALQVAADELFVSTDELIVVAAEAHAWPDSSLGCPEPGRAYSQIVTAGYLVTIDTADGLQEVAVHTDRIGQRTAVC
jgi:hypothetical protein